MADLYLDLKDLELRVSYLKVREADITKRVKREHNIKKKFPFYVICCIFIWDLPACLGLYLAVVSHYHSCHSPHCPVHYVCLTDVFPLCSVYSVLPILMLFDWFCLDSLWEYTSTELFLPNTVAISLFTTHGIWCWWCFLCVCVYVPEVKVYFFVAHLLGCERRLSHSDDLACHICAHMGVKPFHCPVRKHFTLSDHLLKCTHRHSFFWASIVNHKTDGAQWVFISSQLKTLSAPVWAEIKFSQKAILRCFGALISPSTF